MEYIAKTAVLIAWQCTCLVACSGASPEDPAFENDRGQQPNGAPSNLDAAKKAAPTPDVPATRHVAEIKQWGLSSARCGLESSPALPAPDEIMKNVPREERAGAIFAVLMTERLGTTEVKRLLELLAATGDPRAFEYVKAVYDGAEAIVERNVGASIETEPDMANALRFRSNELMRVRERSMSVAGTLNAPGVLAFLTRGAQDESPAVRRAAAVGLAKRPDFADRQQLQGVLQGLPEMMREPLRVTLVETH
jgi:hypothetical protein